ncbi:hypothetical protein H6P81_016035 [Aristolochia fimbriata]|uniref:Uncharacterized protein n=1 Tax=Aristolochia fimbriata TaxID=158543 RepID=A0AAV7E742_ARIFI|nr:hypothetical protein H6P81_016035 [Aristolochia fimbriata]
MAFSSSSRRSDRPQSGQRPFCPTSVFRSFATLRDRSVPPLPILTCTCGAYGAFAGFAMHRPGPGVRTAAASRVVVRWTSCEQCFRSYEPSSRCAVFPSLHGPPAALLGRWHPLGAFPLKPVAGPEVRPARGKLASRFFPRHSLTPGVLGTPDARVFKDPSECGSPGGLGWIRKRVRSPNLCSTVDAPGPVLRRIASACAEASRSLRGCYLVDPASSHMLVSKIKPCMFKKLVVGPWVGRSVRQGCNVSTRPFYRRCAPGLNWPGRASGAVTLKKLECSKQANALDTLAWDNIT